eukprot:4825928-Prymnesium_polylepis.1
MTSPARRDRCGSTRPSCRRCKTAHARRAWPGRTPRYDDDVPGSAVHGPPYSPTTEHTVQAGQSKGKFAVQLSSAARDALLGWASACEDRPPARASTHDAEPGRPPDGPVVRLPALSAGGGGQQPRAHRRGDAAAPAAARATRVHAR